MTPHQLHRSAGRTWPSLVRGFCLAESLLTLASVLSAAQEARTYDIPAGPAEKSLKVFSVQSGVGVLFATSTVTNIRTNPVVGAYSAGSAIDRLLRGTGLIVHAEANGAFSVTRDANGGRPAQPGTNAERAPSPPSTLTDPGASKSPPKTMKRKNPLSMLGAWLALGLASSQAVQAEDSRSGAASARQTGSVSGHVRNDTTGTYVAGATVAVKGTSKVVTTDQTGFFAIDNLPRGATTLVVSAFDLDTKNVPIEVTPGATAQVEVALSSNFYTLEAFNVTAAREGTARAINDQRNALNIVNVTATDAFGNLRDGNVAEMVARMPGVSVLHVANDIRHVMVRGIDSALGSVTMDGLQLAASEGGGMSRGFPWTQTSADNIETVIVTKAPTPDGDASAIGGSIDLKSKSAFDNRDQRRTEIRVGMNYETAKKLAFPIANFSHRQLFGTERRLGIALNLGYSQYNNVGSASVLGHVTTAAEGPTPLRQANFYDYPAISERFGSGVRIDYRVAGRTTVFTNFAYTSHTNSVRSPSVYRRFNLVAAANGTTVAPGFSDDYAQWNPVASSIARLQVGQYPQFVNSRNFSGGFDHRWGDWKLEGLASYSLAQTRYDMLSQGVAQLQAAVTGVGLILDRRNRDRYFPAITQVSGPDMYRLENYRAETLLLADQWGREKVHSARLDLQRRFGGSLDLTLKTGAKIKNQNRQVTNDNKTYAYAGPDGGLNSGDESLVRFLDQYYTRFDPGHPGYKAPQWFDNQAVARSFKETPSWWVENLNANTRTRLSGNQKINETVSAAYLQAVAKIGPLSVLTGVRVEETRDSATGTTQGISPAELARRAAYVGTLTNAEIVRRATAEYTRITKRASYTNAFPGLHLSYAIRPGLLARASYTESIGRPNFNALIPVTNVNYTGQVVTTNNTGLNPQYSRNWDLSLEYYVKPAGIISLGVFRKDIKDFIFSSSGGIIGSGPDNGFGGDYEGFRLNTQQNGGSAVIRGLEANYSQQLTALPDWLRGFAVNMNYTRLLTSGDYGGSATSPVTQLANFVPTSANAGITYTGHGVTARLLWRYQGGMLRTHSANPLSALWIDSRVELNAGLSYAINRWVTLYLDASNLTDTLPAKYIYRPELVQFNSVFGRRFDVSARLRF